MPDGCVMWICFDYVLKFIAKKEGAELIQLL